MPPAPPKPEYSPVTDPAAGARFATHFRLTVEPVLEHATQDVLGKLSPGSRASVVTAIRILRDALSGKPDRIHVGFYSVANGDGAQASFNALAANGRGEIRWHPTSGMVTRGNRALHEAVHAVIHQRYPIASMQYDRAAGSGRVTADDLRFKAYSEYEAYKTVAEFEAAAGMPAPDDLNPDQIARAQRSVNQPIMQLGGKVPFDPAAWRPKR